MPNKIQTAIKNNSVHLCVLRARDGERERENSLALYMKYANTHIRVIQKI